jgi:cytochrome c biogenesis protein CcmG/thiol:disulfide interchange protein DsbE
MKKNLFIPFIGLFILAICAFYYFNQAPSQKLEAKQVPPVLFEAKDFYKNELIDTQKLGDLYIINFFASWCKPCLAEHPLLMELQSKGIKIIGVNFRDDEDNFIDWIEENGNPFEYIIRDDGSIAYEMGLIGVPETYFINKKIIQKKIQGPLFYEDIENYL